jgi:hypothetical protein
MTQDNSSAQLVERLRHKDSEAMSKAADLIEALTRPRPSTSSVEAVARAVQLWWMTQKHEPMHQNDALDLARAAIAALPSPEREPMREEWQPLRDLVDAARGLSHGVDWNNGTNAKLHGYRRKLLDALPGAEAALAALAPPPAHIRDTDEDADELAEHWRKQCNRYVNGFCSTRRCLVRGGYSGSGPVESVQEYLDAFVDGDFDKACGYIAEESKKKIETAGSCEDVLAKASKAVAGTDASMEGAKASPGKVSGKSGTVKVTTKGGLKIEIPVLVEDDRWKVNRGSQ